MTTWKIDKTKFIQGPFGIGTFIRQEPIRDDILSSQIVKVVSEVIYPTDPDDEVSVGFKQHPTKGPNYYGIAIYPKQIGEVVMDFNNTRNIGKSIDIELRHVGMVKTLGQGWEPIDVVEVGKLGSAWNHFIEVFMSGTKR